VERVRIVFSKSEDKDLMSVHILGARRIYTDEEREGICTMIQVLREENKIGNWGSIFLWQLEQM